MFNPAYQVPMQMFCSQHIIALIVVCLIILSVFLSRKFFMKNAIADKIFRYTLAFILIGSELVLQFLHNPTPIFSRFFADTYPLCGYMIWFTSFALITNSKRLMKIIYPFTLLGGILSLIVLDMHAVFPHFGAFQFFTIHAGFMIGSLYFLFTQKIQKYTLKDLKHSFIFLAGISCYMLLICAGKLHMDKTFTDPFFIISPPGGLEFFKNALGQIGYTLLYLTLVASLLFAFYGITYFCTRKRITSYNENKTVKNNKFMDKVSAITPQNKILILFLIFVFAMLVSTLNKVAGIFVLNYLDIVCFFAFYIALIIYEFSYIYQTTNKVILDENTSVNIEQ